MIQNFSKAPKVMEFTTFKKKENITDDELLQAVLKFEEQFLAKQSGILFHCLVRNYNNEYANVLFAENMDVMQNVIKQVHDSPEANHFFSLIKEGSVSMNFNQIQKDNFKIPKHFTCVEYGTFALQSEHSIHDLVSVSNTIENNYLNETDNTQGHFIGSVSENLFSEVTFGKTLAKTKEVCFGYTTNTHCKPLLNMANPESMQLDFWYLIA